MPVRLALYVPAFKAVIAGNLRQLISGRSRRPVVHGSSCLGGPVGGRGKVSSSWGGMASAGRSLRQTKADRSQDLGSVLIKTVENCSRS